MANYGSLFSKVCTTRTCCALIDGHEPDDAEIIREVRENWHATKARSSPDRLKRGLDWLRTHSLTPQGHLPRTVHQEGLLQT